MRKTKKILSCQSDSIGCKIFSLKRIMTLFREEELAKLVPAAAVIRGVLTLCIIIRRKGLVGGIFCCA